MERSQDGAWSDGSGWEQGDQLGGSRRQEQGQVVAGVGASV